MKRQAAIVREYRPLPGDQRVGGVAHDGRNVWFAAGDKLQPLDPASGKVPDAIDVAALAGTAFGSDGRDLFYCGGASAAKVRAVRRSRRLSP